MATRSSRVDLTSPNSRGSQLPSRAAFSLSTPASHRPSTLHTSGFGPLTSHSSSVSTHLSSATMAGTSHRGAQVRWNHEMRLTLCLLWELETDMSKRLAVFNTVFKDHLDACGLADGATVTRLRVQYCERSKTPLPKCWQAVTNASEVERQAMTIKIREAQASLGELPSAPLARSKVPNPPTSTSIKKRAYVQLQDIAPGQSKNESPIPVKRSKKRVAIVQVTAHSASVTVAPFTTPRTPKTRRVDATVLHTCSPSGHQVWLRPDEYAKTQLDWSHVDEASIHLNLSGLLFRYWDENSSIKLENGFIASHFKGYNIDPAPLPSINSRHFPWAMFHTHLNRTRFEAETISTSNFLVWVFRLALKMRQKGARHGRITLINASALDRDQVYHMPPIHKELCKKYAFENGAQNYHGSHEFQVYYRIPAEAVLSTITVDELADLCSRCPSVNALGFAVLGASRDYRTKIRPQLQDAKVALTPKVVCAIAKIISTCGLRPAARVEHIAQIAHMVSDIVQGFGLYVNYSTATEWRQISAIFAWEMTRTVDKFSIDLQQKESLRLAFLDGVRWSCGPFNARYSVEGVSATQKRAARLSLAQPLHILLDELASVKSHLTAYAGEHSVSPPPSLLRSGDNNSEDLSLSEDDSAEIVYDNDGICDIQVPEIGLSCGMRLSVLMPTYRTWLLGCQSPGWALDGVIESEIRTAERSSWYGRKCRGSMTPSMQAEYM
ncbi:hypothetical protein BAUCODRAFT_24775 [Baudoinia panamericana UAMH 10762]|uniref:DUF7587 domain-containing protein n=1 Tax=Baudoinia panamericana (strain UAMH 10762) TaxID=717646 RepID=M2LN41_BAUPA|nr:uncharacterized protein BAUCODRAFT_24775 [Baudoinia panamericana UAMH 10762]EMC95762.1 hypothetical protein BAUCODRAFT_24775 [Baudoinia panamericana UAMH 10762]